MALTGDMRVIINEGTMSMAIQQTMVPRLSSSRCKMLRLMGTVETK